MRNQVYEMKDVSLMPFVFLPYFYKVRIKDVYGVPNNNAGPYNNWTSRQTRPDFARINKARIKI